MGIDVYNKFGLCRAFMYEKCTTIKTKLHLSRQLVNKDNDSYNLFKAECDDEVELIDVYRNSVQLIT